MEDKVVMKDRLYTALSTGVIFAATVCVIIAGVILGLLALVLSWAWWIWDNRKRRSGCQTKR